MGLVAGRAVSIQSRCDTALISELFRHLLNEMVKAPLAKGVGGVALAFGDRFGARQPVEDWSAPEKVVRYLS